MIDFSISNNWQDFKELITPLVWTRTGIRSYVCADRKNWLISWNNFPEEPLFTIFIQGVAVLHFDEFPTEWKRIDT